MLILKRTVFPWTFRNLPCDILTLERDRIETWPYRELDFANVSDRLFCTFLFLNLLYYIKSRFAKKPQMAIFWCENAAKRLLFSKSSWKTRKKNVKEKFFSWSYGGQIWGQKWTHTKIDHFTRNRPNSSKLSIFHRLKAQNEEN